MICMLLFGRRVTFSVNKPCTFVHLLGLKEFDKVHKHENAVKPIGMFFFVMEFQMKTQDFQKHWTLPHIFKKYNLDALLH